MAVIAVWKCDRDGAMFENKKDAEAHDKMLELAEGITQLLRRTIDEIDEEISRKVGLVLAGRSDELVKACKGKTEALLTEEEEPQEPNVAPLVAQQ